MFNLAYKLFMVPYQIEYNVKLGSYTVTSTTWKKYFTLILTGISAILASAMVNSAFSEVSLRTPAVIFEVAPEIGDIYLCFTIWYVVWRRKNAVCAFWTLMTLQTYKLWRRDEVQTHFHINESFMKNPQIFSSKPPKRKSVDKKGNLLYPSIFCVIILLLVAVLDVIKIIGTFATFHGEKSVGTFLNFLKTGLFLPTEEPKTWNEINTAELLVFCCLSFLMCYIKVFKGFAILLAIAGVIVILQNACELEEYLKTEADQLKIIQAFQHFRDFLEVINEIIGPIIFGVGIVCAPSFSVANLARIMVSWNYESPNIWVTMWIYTFVLMGSAEVINKIDEFREWILENGEGEYEQHLFCMFVDLTQNPVGIRGMQYFTVTYSFVAQMSSAVVTFTIILLQFQSG
ncbi:unnamed protein product [Orchesella dallaii]|uniref:Gustatory receptor n=1 Tax=Orchesella dallaii TaxID=48710 RepID=A0ABP1S305_9HEXA